MKEYKLKINGNDYNVVIKDVEESTANVEVNGSNFVVEFEKPISKPKAIKIVRQVTSAPAIPAATPAAPKAPAAKAAAGETPVNSPLPGVILNVNCKEGDSVKSGQVLMILEAMKMENEIQAPCDGVVKKISVQKGESVLEGATLVILG